MPYYIHGRDLQAVNASKLQEADLAPAVDKAFSTNQFPSYLQNKDFIYSALMGQLNANDLTGDQLEKDRTRSTFVHGGQGADYEHEFAHVSPAVRTALRNNYPQNVATILPLSLGPQSPYKIGYKCVVSIDEMQDARLQSSAPSEEKRPEHTRGTTDAWQLYGWNINSDISLRTLDVETPVPGYAASQLRITENGNVVDYAFFSNRLLYDLCTQPIFPITKDRIEEAEAEERFNLAVYFPLKIALRQLGASKKAKEFEALLNNIDAEIERAPKPRRNGNDSNLKARKFDALTIKFQPLLDEAMNALASAPQEEKTDKDTYVKMQADDRCMLLAVVREKLVSQVDKPIAAILRTLMPHFVQGAPDVLEPELSELVQKLQNIQTQPFNRNNKILLQMSNPDYYDDWVASFISDLREIATNPPRELEEHAFNDVPQTMDVMIELARLQQLAHKAPHTPQSKMLQDYINRAHSLWETVNAVSDDEDKLLIKTDLHKLSQKTKAITTLDILSPVAFHSFAAIESADKEMLEHINTLLNLEAQRVKKADEEKAEAALAPSLPAAPEKKSWKWFLLSAVFVLAAIAINFVPVFGQVASAIAAVELAAEHLLYIGMGFAAIAGGILAKDSKLQSFFNFTSKWWGENKEAIKTWGLRILGVVCLAAAIAINAIPGAGQVLSGVFSYVGFALLNIACGVGFGLSLFNLKRSQNAINPAPIVAAIPAPDLDPPVETPVAVAMPIESVVAHRQRPENLYELPEAFVVEEKLDGPGPTHSRTSSRSDSLAISSPSEMSVAPPDSPPPSSDGSDVVPEPTEMKTHPSTSSDEHTPPPSSPSSPTNVVELPSQKVQPYVKSRFIHFNEIRDVLIPTMVAKANTKSMFKDEPEPASPKLN